MSIWIALMAAPFCYAAIAGLVVSLLGLEYRPPCKGMNRDARGTCECFGWGDPYGSCRDCRAHRRYVLTAALWPFVLPKEAVLRVFRATAGVRIVGQSCEEPHREEVRR